MFNNAGFQNYSIRLFARVEFHVYILKIAEVVHFLHTTTGILNIKGFARFDFHFSGNYITLGLLITLDCNAFELAFIDGDC
ncbi:hypothetical protein SDC9_194117 [bioreactor metagenome]|uniref:Uncharacterized protein n=1 Tax=bioreactor metagenome TaxID=1076179 RepID=A0A645I5J6_9ZZZZ